MCIIVPRPEFNIRHIDMWGSGEKTTVKGIYFARSFIFELMLIACCICCCNSMRSIRRLCWQVPAIGRRRIGPDRKKQASSNLARHPPSTSPLQHYSPLLSNHHSSTQVGQPAMLRYSIVSSQHRLSSAIRQRAAAQLLSRPAASSRITGGQV